MSRVGLLLDWQSLLLGLGRSKENPCGRSCWGGAVNRDVPKRRVGLLVVEADPAAVFGRSNGNHILRSLLLLFSMEGRLGLRKLILLQAGTGEPRQVLVLELVVAALPLAQSRADLAHLSSLLHRI